MYSSTMTSMKPETLDRYRYYLREHAPELPEHVIELLVRVTDDFYDQHYSPNPSRPFIEAWEKKARHGKNIDFFIPEIVLFCAKAAGEGVIQNVAWAVVKHITNAIWIAQHKKDYRKKLFEAVVSIKKYRKVRVLKYPGTQPLRRAPAGFEECIRKQYKLTVR